MAILKRTDVKVKVQYAGGSSAMQGGIRHQALSKTGNIQIFKARQQLGKHHSRIARSICGKAGNNEELFYKYSLVMPG